MLRASPDLLDDSVPAVRPRTHSGGLTGHHRIEDNDQEDAIVRVAGSVNADPPESASGDPLWDDAPSRVRRRGGQHRRRRRGKNRLTPGTFLDGELESLDYEVVHSQMNIEHRLILSSYGTIWHQLQRLFACTLIGSATAFCACVLTMGINLTEGPKFDLIYSEMYKCKGVMCVVTPFLVWCALNVTFACVAYCCAHIEPVSVGSGIPQIKCYLNGVKIPRCVRLKTLFTKLIGVYASVMAGLPVGKEGPMIHSGAVLAAGISQGKSSTLAFSTPFFKMFREDHEKRDFVACGTAAGVSAAFGAPGGGVMFAIEEGASHLHQDLLWRFLFTSFLATLVLKQVLSAYFGHPGELLFSGLLDFGAFGQVVISALGYEALAYGILACSTGLLGAAFVSLNLRISLFRRTYMKSWRSRGGEVVLVSLVMVLVAHQIALVSGEYRLYGHSIDSFLGRCKLTPDTLGMTNMMLRTPESSLRSLLHDPLGTYLPLPIGMFALYYLVLTCWTYGLAVPSGVFIPSLVTGAAIGRFAAAVLLQTLPNPDWVDPSKFALFGAAGMLAGVVRMAISLTFIIVEATGVVNIGPLLMFVLIIAKYVADSFNESLYDAHIELDGIPLLSWRPPPEGEHISMATVMAAPVRVLPTSPTAGQIYDLLDSCLHNGFPVVEYEEGEVPSELPPEPCSSDCSDEEACAGGPGQAALAAAGVGALPHYGRYRGLVLRSQLVEILKNKPYLERGHERDRPLTNDDYPRYPSHKEVHLSTPERGMHVDLTYFMNPGCMVVLDTGNLPRVYETFRAQLLRHVVVVNKYNQVVGMVTRKDLCRYRAGGPLWNRGVHHVPVVRRRPPATPDQPVFGVCRHLVAERMAARAQLSRDIPLPSSHAADNYSFSVSPEGGAMGAVADGGKVENKGEEEELLGAVGGEEPAETTLVDVLVHME